MGPQLPWFGLKTGNQFTLHVTMYYALVNITILVASHLLHTVRLIVLFWIIPLIPSELE